MTGEGEDAGVMSILSSSTLFWCWPVHRLRISFTKDWNSFVNKNDCQLCVEFDFVTSGRKTLYPFVSSRFDGIASVFGSSSIGASSDEEEAAPKQDLTVVILSDDDDLEDVL